MRDAMVDVVQSGTGRGIRTPMYHIAGKTGTAQVKSIAQGKRYNESLLTERQLDHGLFIGFAPAENPGNCCCRCMGKWSSRWLSSPPGKTVV